MIRHAKRWGWALVAVMTLLAPIDACADPAAGVALDLATARAQNISHLRYELTLSIPATRAQPVTGINVLRFRLAARTKPLVVDFEAEDPPDATMTANGIAVPTQSVNGHLVIPAASL